MSLRIGQGFDVHAFATDRELILGGVKIESERGLIGHSDADVLTHAIMDALLGATGGQDIGELFPDSDPKFKDARSINLLEEVVERIEKEGWQIVNVDSTLLLEAPKISKYRQAMRTTLARALNIPLEDCTIKATTMEQLGFIGRKEGVVASSVVLLKK